MKLKLLLIGLFCTILSLNLCAQEQEYEILRLTEKVLKVKMTKGYHASFIIITNKGLVVVDTYYWPTQMAKVKPMIEKELNRDDFIYLINTHAHLCHVGGNNHFKDIPQIGQKNILEGIDGVKKYHLKGYNESKERHGILKKEVEEAKNDGKDAKELLEEIAEIESWWTDYEDIFSISYPDITFKDKMTLYLDDITLELIYAENFHSPEDMIIYIPEEQVLILGQAFMVSVPPVIPGFPRHYSKTSMENRLSVISELLEKDIEIIVTNHGDNIISKNDFDFYSFYLKDMLKNVKNEINKGSTLDEIKENLQIEKIYSEYISKDDIIENVLKKHNKNIERIWNNETEK